MEIAAPLPAILLFSTACAWAQDDDANQYSQAAPPDMWSTYGERVLILVSAGAVGFAVGACFSPLLKPFRKFIWLDAVALGVLYALFGPSPDADILNGGVAFVVFLIALALGLRLGRTSASMSQNGFDRQASARPSGQPSTTGSVAFRQR